MLNGIGGYLLGGWNYPIDTHMTQVLGDMEVWLSETLQRPILCNIFDSEGSGHSESGQGRNRSYNRGLVAKRPEHHKRHQN